MTTSENNRKAKEFGRAAGTAYGRCNAMEVIGALKDFNAWLYSEGVGFSGGRKLYTELHTLHMSFRSGLEQELGRAVEQTLSATLPRTA